MCIKSIRKFNCHHKHYCCFARIICPIFIVYLYPFLYHFGDYFFAAILLLHSYVLNRCVLTSIIQIIFRGYNIGIRLIEDLLARSDIGRCNDFRETADVIAKVKVIISSKSHQFFIHWVAYFLKG